MQVKVVFIYHFAFPINKFNKYEYFHHTRCVSQDDVDDVHHPVGGEVVPLDDVADGEVAGDGELAREGRHLLLLILLLLIFRGDRIFFFDESESEYYS